MEPVNRNPAELEPRENVFLGVVGALLFSLAGAVVYFILNRVGYIASLSAMVGAYCACFGYALFSRKKGSKIGTVVAAVATILVMVLAVVFCLAFDLYEYIKEDYANVKLTEVFGDTVRSLFNSSHPIEYGYYVYSFERSSFVKDLIGTLIFTALGIVGFISAQRTKRKAAQQSAQAQAMPVQPVAQPTRPESDTTNPEE